MGKRVFRILNLIKEIDEKMEARVNKEAEPFKKMKKDQMIKHLGSGYGSLKSRNKTQLLELIKTKLKYKFTI